VELDREASRESGGVQASPMASSHIILPKEEEEEEKEAAAVAEAGLGVGVEADHDSPAQRPYQEQAPGKAALPFSATCVRISRDSYPNLRALRNASTMALHDDDAAFVKIEEGDFGYVLDDVPHLTDYLPDLPVSAATPSRALWLPRCQICCSSVKNASDTTNCNDGIGIVVGSVPFFF